jgi:uncharacterized repeat protein (TIGR04076 family)
MCKNINPACGKPVMSDDEYKEAWKSLGRIEIRMVEKIGKCVHEQGDVFYYETPYEKPKGVCKALLHVLDLYTWRVVLGFPSWEADDRNVYRIHCPSKKGTVWEVRK